MPALIIHGHFYQPPRENPRTGEIERQESAAPYHDWNERVYAECYGPNAFAWIGGDTSERVVNNYANISFNFGPTLLSWLEKHAPQTYLRILKADAESIRNRSGHGNGIAQAYGHAILPLLNRRDRLTHVVWGLADFRFRFRREAESIWLPETACNDEVLELLIEQGMRYVILSPQQARRVRLLKNANWIDVSMGRVDTTQPYRFFHRDGSGRSLVVFFYDGPLARAIAFERALTSSKELVARFVAAAKTGPLVTVATDGETYGHHFKFGDLCLAHALEIEAREAGFQITNYGEYLDSNEPLYEVEIDNGPLDQGTSWSCTHGVGRWSHDCGCYTGGETGWKQIWRQPLLDALEFLRTHADQRFEKEGGQLLLDPWEARNAYIEVILNAVSLDEFLNRQCRAGLNNADRARALKLLEIQRNSLLMFTSCGWFFSDLAGIETVQVLRYAARVIELETQIGLEPPRTKFLQLVAQAHSNIREKGSGADIFLRIEDSNQQSPFPEPTTVV